MRNSVPITAVPAVAQVPLDCGRAPVVHALYEKMGRALISRARRVVRREDIACEILQETFVRLWQLKPRFATELAAFTWLYRTSHNLALDHLRSAFARNQASQGDRDDDVEANGPGPDQVAERQQVLARILDRLTADEASVYVYRTVDAMTHDEIAEHLGISSKTASRMLARIEDKLARIRVTLHDPAWA